MSESSPSPGQPAVVDRVLSFLKSLEPLQQASEPQVTVVCIHRFPRNPWCSRRDSVDLMFPDCHQCGRPLPEIREYPPPATNWLPFDCIGGCSSTYRVCDDCLTAVNHDHSNLKPCQLCSGSIFIVG